MQTVMIIPVFISYAAVQFIVYAYLSTDTGILNNTFNIATRFYSTPKAWPWILTIVKCGTALVTAPFSICPFSLVSILRFMRLPRSTVRTNGSRSAITLPSLLPMITVMLLLSVGNIMRSDTGLFYQVTRNSGVLYSTTQVIDSYVLNSIFKNSNFGFTAATTFFQSIVGLFMMLLANGLVRKIAPENALF